MVIASVPSEVWQENSSLLSKLATDYIWWKTPAEAMEFPERVVAQVMNTGTFEDASRMAQALGDDCLRAVLQRAEAGQFNGRSWHYWHYRLGLAESGSVPPMPVRRIE